jgi:hypothetical protein
MPAIKVIKYKKFEKGYQRKAYNLRILELCDKRLFVKIYKKKLPQQTFDFKA